MVLVSFSFLWGKTPQSFPVPKYVGDGGISAHSTCCRFHRSSFFPAALQLRWQTSNGKLMVGRQSFRFGKPSCWNQLRALSFREGDKITIFHKCLTRELGKIWGRWVFFFGPKKFFVACGFRTSTPWWTMCKLGCCLNIPKLALRKFPTISSLYHQLPKTPYNITKHHPSKTDLFEVKEDMAASYGHHHLVPMLSTFHTWSFNDSKKNSEKIWFRQLVTPRRGQKLSKMNWQPPSQTQIDGLDSM